MSKAEETARHYLLNEHKSPLNQILHQADLKTELQYHTDIENACKYGYHQAEKDLELGWEDIELIVNIDQDTNNEESIIGVRKNEEHYQEVLKRFKEIKGGMYKTWNSLRENLKEDNQGNIVGGLKL